MSILLPEPPFSSPLTDIIIELDYLRKKKLGGTTPAPLFFQLKDLFHTLESIGSARIEGNRTTIAEFIETKIVDGKEAPTDSIREITNMEMAMDYIEKHAQETPVNRAFLSDLHKMVVIDLKREGDATPGEYRKKNVRIAQASHVPPDYAQVPSHMDELFDFINRQDPHKYDLLKTAIAHHRFAWIHPFGNGNGRTVRLLTYTMLVKQGFNVEKGRIINPTAVFCIDRNKYYEELARADACTEEALLGWAMYVLSGLKTEIEKVDRLAKYVYLKENILLPALDFSLKNHMISDIDSRLLKVAIEQESFKAADIAPILGEKLPQQVSRVLRSLKERNLIMPIEKGGRKYTISFSNSFLLRGVMHMLDKHGFLPLKNEV